MNRALTTRSALTLALFSWACLGGLTACTTLPKPTINEHIPGHSLRVVTFNTALLSNLMRCGPIDPVCHETTEGEMLEHAGYINQVLASGYFDVVALNEVWDEDGKASIRESLGKEYPFWVEYVDVFGGGFDEDSGLMLFSELPFEDIAPAGAPARDNVTSYGSDADRVIFYKYSMCSSEGFLEFKDCDAAKGALYVRLKHQGSGRIIHLFPTHLQASYHDSDKTEDANVRCQQLGMITGLWPLPSGPWCYPKPPSLLDRFVPLALNESFARYGNREWIVVLGDLNIDGAGAFGDAIYPAEATTAGANEYEARIGSMPSTSGLYDPWAQASSVADTALTTRDERLDHILVSRRTTGSGPRPTTPDLCVQHAWNPPSLEGLSDHRAAAVDLNLAAPQCNPRLAYVVPEKSLGTLGSQQSLLGERLHGRLEHPGSMQWWRLEEPGTYTIALGDLQGLRYEIYAATDLSHPLKIGYELDQTSLEVCDLYGPDDDPSPDNCLIEEATSYVLPMGPVYVRVFAEERDLQGPYWIAFRRHTCKQAADFCELLPNLSQEFTFPEAAQLNQDDAAWFRVRIKEQLPEEERQQLRFVAGSPSDSGQERVRVYLSDLGGTQLSELDGESLPPMQGYQWPSYSTLVARAIDATTASNADFYLRAGRLYTDAPITIRVTWQTDLLLAGGSQVGNASAWIKCDDETGSGISGEWGSDTIRLLFAIPGSPAWEIRGQTDFDCDRGNVTEPWDDRVGVVTRREAVTLRLQEYDGFDSNENSTTRTYTFPMDKDLALEKQDYIKAWYDWGFSGGEYQMSINFGKWRR